MASRLVRNLVKRSGAMQPGGRSRPRCVYYAQAALVRVLKPALKESITCLITMMIYVPFLEGDGGTDMSIQRRHLLFHGRFPRLGPKCPSRQKHLTVSALWTTPQIDLFPVSAAPDSRQSADGEFRWCETVPVQRVGPGVGSLAVRGAAVNPQSLRSNRYRQPASYYSGGFLELGTLSRNAFGSKSTGLPISRLCSFFNANRCIYPF